RIAPALGDHSRALHQHFFGLDEVEPRIAPDARMYVGVHANGVAGARLDAVAAVDAAQRVDLVARRILLYRGILALGCLDVDALRGTGRRAEKARRTTHGAILLERQAVASSVVITIALALFGILHGDHRAPIFEQPDLVGKVETEVSPKTIPGDH